IVFANVDDGKFPDRGHVHRLVEHTLSESAVTEETNGNASVAKALRRKRRAGCDRRASADDGVGAEVAGVGIRNVHRTALALAITGSLAEQFGKHAIEGGALRHAVPVPSMRAGDVVIRPQGFADADGNGLLTCIKVSKTRH